MGLLGRIFGTEKALEKTVEAAANGLDKLWYSEQEKAEDAAKDRAEARAVIVDWMEATQGQNLARRLIALCITGVWLLLYIIWIISGMVAIWVDEIIAYDKIVQVGEIAQNAAVDMNPAVMLIIGFYFAAPHLGDIAKAFANTPPKMRRKG